jgi:hypothetical protein
MPRKVRETCQFQRTRFGAKLSLIKFSFKKTIFEKELKKTKQTASDVES